MARKGLDILLQAYTEEFSDKVPQNIIFDEMTVPG